MNRMMAHRLDAGLGLDLDDVCGCVWFVWKRALKIKAPYLTSADLMPVKINETWPAWRGGGVEAEEAAQRFFGDLLRLLESYTGYRAHLSFAAFVRAYDAGRTWNDLAATLYANAYDTVELEHAA